jgi:hypothetical protein
MNERVKPKNEDKAVGRTELALPSRRLNELRDALQFDKRKLDETLERQGKDYMDIADEVAFAISRRDKWKDDHANARAKAFIDSRNPPEGQKKPTVDEISAMVDLDPYVMKAQDGLREAELELKRLQALEEAWRQRSYAIKEMVTLEVDAYGRVPDGAGRREYSESRAHSREAYRDKR